MSSPNRDPSKVDPWQSTVFTKALITGGEMGCLMLVIVLAAVFGGLWLDNLLGTKPLFTIGLVLASVPISLGLSVWIALRTVRSNTPLPPAGDNTKSTLKEEGETTGE
jgi:hypothetical protein